MNSEQGDLPPAFTGDFSAAALIASNDDDSNRELRLLINNGLDLTGLNDEGQNLLGIAAANGNTKAMTILLEAGFDPEYGRYLDATKTALNPDWQSPLGDAIFLGDEEGCVLQLLNAGLTVFDPSVLPITAPCDLYAIAFDDEHPLLEFAVLESIRRQPLSEMTKAATTITRVKRLLGAYEGRSEAILQLLTGLPESLRHHALDHML